MRARGLTAILTGLGAACLLQAAEPVETPRLADGRPDFNGTWDNGSGIEFVRPVTRADGLLCVSGCSSGAPAAAARPPAPIVGTAKPRYRPELAAKVEDLKRRQVKEDGVLRCQPPGVPRIGPPDKIVQTAREIIFLYEDVSGAFFKIVPLVPGVKRADDSETWLGDAEGHWDGDTLVVVSRNFNDLTWLTDDGAFHSTSLLVTERLTRRGNEVEWLAVADDPQVLAEPWQLRPRRMTRTEVELAEPAPCMDQDLARMQDDSYHSNPR